jgi:lysophospholipase L1-like esterase
VRRALNVALMGVYVAAIYFACDFVYTKFLYETDRLGRIAHNDYHHGLMANFEGYETWGRLREKIYTNSLGFKDGKIRDVPAKFDGKRVLLIGDSFTEGVGLAFDDTFAGMLYQAGQKRAEKIEFLNAGVISYSPAIYYRKIKYLLDAGLKFDEVVVFSDLSDVQDEAMSYFCIDEIAEFQRYCAEPPYPPTAKPPLTPVARPQPPRKIEQKLKDHFAMTNRLLQLFWHEFDTRSGSGRRFADRLHTTQRAGWTMNAIDVEKVYQPLGVEGGVRRSIMHMEALAELLRSRGILLTVAVYPWPFQLIYNDRQSRQVAMWRKFCEKNCARFVDLFPVVFAEKEARRNWYEEMFISGDIHYSPEGNRVLFEAIAKELM